MNDAYSVLREIKTVATSRNRKRTLIKQQKDWEDDYIKDPKESGYRALSLLVGVPVAIGDHTEHVTCEIQIRTLLQHAWGELTHEDTYKPEAKVPELFALLSKRLANTLAALDEIAQDVRNELDRLQTEQAAPIPLPESTSTTQPVASQPEPAAGTARPQAPAPPPEPVLPPVTPSLTVETIQQAFRAVLGREPDVKERQYEALLARSREVGISSPDELISALQTMKNSIVDLESEYEGVAQLNDYGRLLFAPLFAHDTGKGMEQVRAAFEERAQRLRFEKAYQVGREVLGTVVHVAPDYALVQLPGGDTGIIHVTEMKASPFEYVRVREVMTEGNTVRAQILKANAVSKRIELKLVRE